MSNNINLSELEEIINNAWDNNDSSTESQKAVNEVITCLDEGALRVAEKIGDNWQVNQWIKKAVLLSFKFTKNSVISSQDIKYYDKVPSKFSQYSDEEFKSLKIRVVPGASVRKGSYIAQNTVLMPSFINIGAYVDSGTMVDTWATVGSCAQIGKNVHLSGGVGIGGVLEPLQANPTVIEDNCFIGARSEVVEGVIVEKNSVISMGVFIGKSTKIYNRNTDEISYGRVPSGSVVVAGSLPSTKGKANLNCAVIVKQVDEQTRNKTAINDLLRED
jgi:2,3,4,5-tetrahydropyridine-2-carboxylate N-succinyltransferase